MSTKVFVYILIAFAYDVSPVDLIPDFVPFIGTLDDAFVSAAMVWLAARNAGGQGPRT